MQKKEDGRIEGLNLTITNQETKKPVYYVTVRSRNGAGDFSPLRTSTPIIVVEEDKPGESDKGGGSP